MVLEEYDIATMLAGGQGSRLYILTKYRGKPAVAIFGKYRISDIPTANVYNSGIPVLAVIPQYEPRSLNYHYGDGSDFGFDNKTRYFEMWGPRTEGRNVITSKSTADAIRINMEKIKRYNPHKVLILSGDHVYSMNYEDIIKEHSKRIADATIMVTPVSEEKVNDLGILMVDEEGRIRDFAEKPKDKETIQRFKLNERLKQYLGIKDPKLNWLGSMGNYVFDTDNLESILNNSEGIDFGKEIIPEMIKDGMKLYAYAFQGYWRDVGKLKDYFECNMDFCKFPTPFSLKRPRILTAERSLPGASVAEGAHVDGILSPGVEINSGSILNKVVCGYNVEVEENCKIDNSLLLGADRDLYNDKGVRKEYRMLIGQGSHLSYVIFDKNITIGKNVNIDPNNMSIQERDKKLQNIGLKPYKVNNDGTIEGDYYLEGKLLVLGKQRTHLPQKELLPDNFTC